MSAEVKLSTSNAWGVLRNAPFRRYVIGSLISDTGSWMQVMAQGWVMATLTNKAIWLGMANLAAGLPMLLLTMVGGAAADRFDKRKILLITQFVQIGIACGIGFLVLKGKIEIWQILAFAASARHFEFFRNAHAIGAGSGTGRSAKKFKAESRLIVRFFTAHASSDQQLAVI